jgi:hypothetical protein
MMTSPFRAPPLWKLTLQAVGLLAEELEDMIASYQVDGGGLESFNDRDAYRHAKRIDRWLKRARAELKRSA